MIESRMKLEELIKMCDDEIERYAADDNPIFFSEPMISFLWPIGRPLPKDFFGVEYQCYSVKRGTAIRIPAKQLKQKLEYALMEGFDVSIRR